MPRPLIKIHDVETGEEIERPMNDAEFAEHEKLVAEFENKNEAMAEQNDAKTALLERLGITADEAKLLLS
jgi:hypothetical protein